MDHQARVRLPVLLLAGAFLILAATTRPMPVSARRNAAGGQQTASKGEVRGHMDEHYAKAEDMQTAVVLGDLAGARESARWIAEHQETAGLPPSGQASVAEMKKAARAVAEASDVKAAAAGSAQMAVACGTCHASTNARPTFPQSNAPVSQRRAMGHMLDHKRAVDLMYRGLVEPSDAAWNDGAKALKAAPLKLEYIRSPSKSPKEAAQFEAETHAIAEKAGAATRPEDRAKVYADLVGGCAECHALYGRVPGEGLPKK